MTKQPDKGASWSHRRLEISLTIAAAIGLLSFAQQLLLAAHPSELKLIASGCAIAGVPAALARISATRET